MVLYPIVLTLTPMEMIALGYAMGVAADAAGERGEEEIAKAMRSLMSKVTEANEKAAMVNLAEGRS